MLRHMVLFSLKDSIDGSDRDYILGQAAKLADISSVRTLAVGRLLDPSDPGYKSHIAADFGYALLIDFDNEDGLYAYQKDPFHVLFAKEIRARASALKVMDFVTP
jgi:hypothetical protein